GGGCLPPSGCALTPREYFHRRKCRREGGLMVGDFSGAEKTKD
ncbi:MAG: hypothetical protein RL472_1920, partial [Pseudomonadota bacterium]